MRHINHSIGSQTRCRTYDVDPDAQGAFRNTVEYQMRNHFGNYGP
jgi:hypothetical protein